MNDKPKVRRKLSFLYALPILILIGLCAYLAWQKALHRGPQPLPVSDLPFASVSLTNLTVQFFGQGDALRAGRNEVVIEFRDGRKKLVDVGAVNLDLGMSMPEMVMHTKGKGEATGDTGRYRAIVEPRMTGDWSAKISFTGPYGSAETNFTITVK